MPIGPEALIVLAVVLLLFGGSKVPALARSLGSAKKEFESASRRDPEPTAGAGSVTVITEPVAVATGGGSTDPNAPAAA